MRCSRRAVFNTVRGIPPTAFYTNTATVARDIVIAVNGNYAVTTLTFDLSVTLQPPA